MTYSVAIPSQVDEALTLQLVRKDGQEDLCFAVWFPSIGATRTTALIHHLLLPGPGDRAVHGNVEFMPSYFERGLQAALEVGGGLAFLHSHPSGGWQGMSDDDVRAEHGLALAVQAATGLPLVGLTLGVRDHTWSARFWERIAPRKYVARWCETVRVVGWRLQVDFCDDLQPPPRHRLRQTRTVSAWGAPAQACLARLRIGVVGAGSVGSIVAEALARTGIRRVELIDFESLEEINLDRTLHARGEYLEAGVAKAAMVADALRFSTTAENFQGTPHELSVCEEEGYRTALDCDVLFSCVDRPWPRSVMNFLAYAHLVPVIDGGIRVSRTPRGGLRGADWKAHTATCEHRCLRCLNQYEPGLVSAERDGYLDDQSYIESLPGDHPARSNQNTFAFSLAAASLEILQLVMLVVSPGGIGPAGAQNYHLVTGTAEIDDGACDEECPFPGLTALGERGGHPGTGAHRAAEQARHLGHTSGSKPAGPHE